MKKVFWIFLLSSSACAAGLEWAGWAKNTADNGILAPAQDLIVVVDSKPRGAATRVQVSFTVNGTNRQSQAMVHHGFANYDTHDRWKLNLGTFPEGARIDYSIEVAGANQALPLEPVSLTVSNAAAAVRWIGDLHTRPDPGALDPGEDLWIFSRMQPRGVAAAAEVGYSLDDGATWMTAPMSPGGTKEGSDVWFANLGGFPEGAAVRFYVQARNRAGRRFWDSNNGADYRIRVNSPIRDVYPGKGRYNPGATAAIQVELQNPGAAFTGTVQFAVSHLGTRLGLIRKPVSLPQGGRRNLSIPWITPGGDFRGYGVDVDLLVDGQVRDSRSTAIDVSSDWRPFPRMGFFSQYPAGADAESLAAALAKYHLNAIQFYDWKWTHDRLVPHDAAGRPLNVFTQVGGRVQSFAAVTAKVAAVQKLNMAALSYNLMYGDSGGDAPEHVEWAAFKKPNSTTPGDIRQHDAGSYKIWVMDVSNPDWKQHIFGQFAEALATAGFDGIHLDNLGGEWCYKYNSDTGIPEREEFPRFINEARRFLRQAHPRAIVTHNDVMGNYLPEIARSAADVYYSEVWSRDTYRDLRENIREVRAVHPAKPVVFAAYINRRTWDDMADPAAPPLPSFINDASARLMAACVFANGAFRIELGDEGHMLVNEYFPARTPRMHAGLARAMRDLYDFIVRYENLLFPAPGSALREATDSLRIASTTHALSKDAGRETVWTLAGRRADGLHTLNLINLYGVDTLWRNACANPVPQTGLALKIHVVGPARRVWLATPDDGLGRPRELPFQSGTDETGAFITLAVPLLEFWNLIWIEPAAPPAE